MRPRDDSLNVRKTGKLKAYFPAESRAEISTMTNSKFVVRDGADAIQLIKRQPLAWIISYKNPIQATPIPLLPESVDHSRLKSLTGHYARSNPQVADFQKDPFASLLFMGPNGYISPSWFDDRTQAPTWNYACVNISARIEFLDNEKDLDPIIRNLVKAMEMSRNNAWGVDEMHERYELLLKKIIPFRAHVLELDSQFKLGQDERDDVYHDIIKGLSNENNNALIELMKDANHGRSA